MKRLLTILFLTTAVASAMQESKNSDFFVLTDKAGSSKKALRRMQKAQYPITSIDELKRIQRPSSLNEGFYEAKLEFDRTINRVIYYQFFRNRNVGEFIGRHRHNENEIFKITLGGCIVKLLLDGKWQAFEKKQGDVIEIPAGIIHCLQVNHRDGLCMHINRDDSTRTLEFVEEEQN
jgi:hypothetical protein